MKLSSRFAEYAVTGGMFWIVLFSAPLIGRQYALEEYLRVLSTKMVAFNAFVATVLHDSLGPLLAGMTIVLVFSTGLLLDLLGSALVFFRNTHLQDAALREHLVVRSAYREQP